MARRHLAVIIMVVMGLWHGTCYGNLKQAQKLYKANDYARAAAVFYQAAKGAKDRSTQAKAEWGLAQSLKRMELYYSSSMYLSKIVRRGGDPKTNPYFRQALDDLGEINNKVNLGQSHIVQLFKTKIDAARIPGAARGFYFYYKGVEAFGGKYHKSAQSYFKRVQSNSQYFVKATFHLGVIANLSGKHALAVNYFEKVRELANDAENGDWLREQANLNIARIYYETKRYRDAIRYYSEIPRESDNWLEALFEASWAFFLDGNANNTLGNIHTLHSPFFDNRFFPESYILQAVTFLRLCRYDKVKESMHFFKERYSPVLRDIKTLLANTERKPKDFFRYIYYYRTGSLKEYGAAWSILDALARTDTYKQAGTTIRNADEELARLSNAPQRWQALGLLGELKGFLARKKVIAISDTGRRLYRQGVGFYQYLVELSNQTKLITAELLLGKVDALRAKLNIESGQKKEVFIGGMKALQFGQELEYWPFEGEYWEDELGFYVYNIASRCQRPKP